MSWARLLKRVFDIEHCPNCGGSLKIIAAIEDPPVMDVAACSATLQRRSLVSELAASVVKKGARGDFDKCERM
jgi:predicted nucleic acid-binding Zn ribbon protein